MGRVLLKKTVSRAKLVETVAKWPSCMIGMEACTGAHEWARRFLALGHTVKLMAPKFVAPYRKSGKNDGNDAEAICEAVARPNMRFVPVKSVEQQAVLTLHRVRQGYVEERTATINRIRGMMAEFGVVLAQRSVEVRRGAARAAEALPGLARQVINEMLEHLRLLDARIEDYERRLASIASDSEAARRLMQLSGIGPITASAVVATVGEAKLFDSGRQFAAWLGLTPRQYSTGGKTRLGGITKRGDRYLRTLFIMGARSVLQTAPRREDRLSRWAMNVRARCGYHKAVVAIAAKNARIAWALLAKGQPLLLAN
jgi:transposase